MSIAIANSFSGNGSATTVVGSSGTSSTNGNVLVALVRSNANVAITLPSNWTSLATGHASTYGSYLLCIADVTTVGAATSYTFTVDTGAVPNAVQIYELSSADTNLSLYVTGTVKTETTATASWTSIGTVTGSMVPAAYQALAFISGITTPTSGGLITPTFTGTYTTDTEVSGLNNCWIQPYYSTAAITVNTAVGLTAATVPTANAGMAINVLIGQAPSGLMINRGIEASAAATRSPAFTLPGGAPVVGNFLSVAISFTNVNSIAFTVPTGWTQVDNSPAGASTSDVGIATLYRVVQGGDTATFTWTNALSNANAVWSLYAREVSGQNSSAPVNQHSYAQTTSAVALTLPSVTPSASGCLALCDAGIYSAPPTLPGSFTSISSGNQSSYLYYNYSYQASVAESPLAPTWGSFQGGTGLVVLAPGGTQHTQSVSGTLSFTSAETWNLNKGLAANLTFASTQTWSLAKGLSATLSFTSKQSRAIAKGLMQAVLSFTGAFTSGHLRQQAFSATLSFTSSQTYALGKSLAGTLSFASTQARKLTKNVSAGLSFVGTLTKSTNHGLSAVVSFTGSQSRSIKHNLGATLSFVGSLTAAHTVQKILSATLSFTSSQTWQLAKGLSGVLSFASTQSHSIGKGVSGTLSFTGSLASTVIQIFYQTFTATLSFASSQTHTVGKNLSGTLSFISSQTHALSKGVAATLAFTGSLTKSTHRGLAAVLSFIGSQTFAYGKNFTATLSFSSAQTRAINHHLAGALSFTSNQAKALAKNLAATLSFTGNISKAFSQVFTATLSFASSQSRSIGYTLAGAITFSGNLTKALSKNLAATLSFIGTLTEQTAQRFFQTFNATLSFSSSISKSISFNLSGILSFLGSLVGIKPPSPVIYVVDYASPLLVADDYSAVIVNNVDYRSPLIAQADYEATIPSLADYDSPIITTVDY